MAVIDMQLAERALCVVQCVLKVDRSNTQLACSQPVSYQPISTLGQSWSSLVDSSVGQSLHASRSFATTVTYCNPDAMVSSVSEGSALHVSDSLMVDSAVAGMVF